MTVTERKDFVLLLEVADALMQAPGHTCSLTVESGRDDLYVMVAIPLTALNAVEAAQRLYYLAGLGQVRAFATQYGIDAGKLEALLPPAGPDREGNR
jgi:hypothetical protein